MARIAGPLDRVAADALIYLIVVAISTMRNGSIGRKN